MGESQEKRIGIVGIIGKGSSKKRTIASFLQLLEENAQNVDSIENSNWDPLVELKESKKKPSKHLEKIKGKGV